MSSNESRYIEHLDRGKQERVTGQGPAAEKFVGDFYSELPGMQTRVATEREDSGVVGAGAGGKMIDLIVYEQTEKGLIPAMGVQVTTDTDPKVIDQKYYKQMREFPFLRLNDEMKREDVAIPRVLIILKPEKIRDLNANPNPELRKELSLKILEQSINSLIFDLQQTKAHKEQVHIHRLIEKLETEKRKLLGQEKETVH